MSEIDPCLTEPPTNATDTPGTGVVCIGRTAAGHVGQSGEVRPRYEALKRFAKVLSKRFAIRLSSAQEMLCRASGFDGMNHLHQLRHADNGTGSQSDEGVSFQVWSRRLRSELGTDFDELLAVEEQLTWWKRLHGRREAVVEPHCPQSPARGLHG